MNLVTEESAETRNWGEVSWDGIELAVYIRSNFCHDEDAGGTRGVR
jgi:hypothetical protein